MKIHTPYLVFLFYAFSAIARASDPLWEENFNGARLDTDWKVSGNKDLVSQGEGQILIKAIRSDTHRLTQIVQTRPDFYFLDKKAKPISLTVNLQVAPQERGAVGRILLSSKAGQARNEDAFAVLVNGTGEYRILIIENGVTKNKTVAWTAVPGGIHKVEITLDETNYTVRFFGKNGTPAAKESGSHEISKEAWGPDTSLALGAWSPAETLTEAASVSFDQATLQRD